MVALRGLGTFGTRGPMVAMVCVVAVCASACGGDRPDTQESSSLTITVKTGSDDTPETTTLVCPGPTAQQRDACAAVDVVAPNIFEPVPVDQACTMVYGGSEVATIAGTFDSQQVDAEFNRTNGCEIARWKQIEPALEALGLT